MMVHAGSPKLLGPITKEPFVSPNPMLLTSRVGVEKGEVQEGTSGVVGEKREDQKAKGKAKAKAKGREKEEMRGVDRVCRPLFLLLFERIATFCCPPHILKRRRGGRGGYLVVVGVDGVVSCFSVVLLWQEKVFIINNNNLQRKKLTEMSFLPRQSGRA